MKWTVAKKIWLGCGILVGVAAVALLVSYRGLVRVQREMHHLSDVHEPIKAAAQEMEINVKGIAIGTLAYLSAPNVAFRELVADAEADFHRFHAEYDRLALTAQQKDLGARLDRLFEQFQAQNRELKVRRDRQAVTFAEVLAKLEEIDPLFDQQLPAALDPQSPNYRVKLESISVIDEGIDAIRMRVATYRWSRAEKHRTMIDQTIEECSAAFQRLKDIRWMTEGRQEAVLAAGKDFEEAMGKVEEVLDDEDEVYAGVTRFIALRDEIDTLLDDEVQPLAAELLRLPRERTEALTNAVVFQMGWLILLFVVSATLACLAVVRAVITPLQSLAQGTEVVSRGNLAHRVPLVGGGEFAVLAQGFNRMVARLQETLVTKESLEKSEQELQRTVGAVQGSLREKEALLQEIHHRVKNNLQVVSSLLQLQSNYVQDPMTLTVLRESQDRVRSMALVHEKLYQSQSLAELDFAEYLRSLVSTLTRAYAPPNGAVRVEVRAEPVNVPINTAIPLGLIVNELVSNSLKHAFPNGRGGCLNVELNGLNGSQLVLSVRDDGVGLPPGFTLEQTRSLGLRLVGHMAEQLHATLVMRNQDGAAFELKFQVSPAATNLGG